MHPAMLHVRKGRCPRRLLTVSPSLLCASTALMSCSASLYRPTLFRARPRACWQPRTSPSIARLRYQGGDQHQPVVSRDLVSDAPPPLPHAYLPADFRSDSASCSITGEAQPTRHPIHISPLLDSMPDAERAGDVSLTLPALTAPTISPRRDSALLWRKIKRPSCRSKTDQLDQP